MSRFGTAGMSTAEDAPDVTVDIDTRGDGEAAETVHMHAKDAIASALQALGERKHPDECPGHVGIDWERRFEIIFDGGGGGGDE